jgi:hypothetical protein
MRSIVREVVTMDVNTRFTVILIGWRSWSFEELIEPLHFLKSKKNGIKQTEFSTQDPKTETLSPNQITLSLSLSLATKLLEKQQGRPSTITVFRRFPGSSFE